ncbi:MAG TPA: ATP-binding cassette domain-containing protein [Conexibacter sp.]|jgi:ABC-type lipoprotein export system ATPase subunit|nr:ATP-binding cassette domain-containing protein [Conexibacter sp.]
MTLLSVEHVGKTHWVGPYEKRVLVDVSLSMHSGDLFGVWGAQRSGKSTLLRIAAGLETADSGAVRFDGTDLASLPKTRRDRLRLEEIGLVQREGPHSSAFNVLDWVANPLFNHYTRRVARNRALAMLRRVDVAECRDARWHQLSDGERTLVSLAHGLVREPRLLLVDDPTAGLDTLQQQEVTELLRAVTGEEQIAVLMTSSVLSAITEAHEAFTLSDGRLIPVTDASRPGAEVIEFPRGDQQTGS